MHLEVSMGVSHLLVSVFCSSFCAHFLHSSASIGSLSCLSSEHFCWVFVSIWTIPPLLGYPAPPLLSAGCYSGPWLCPWPPPRCGFIGTISFPKQVKRCPYPLMPYSCTSGGSILYNCAAGKNSFAYPFIPTP